MVQTSRVRDQQRGVLGLRYLVQYCLKRERLRRLAAFVLKPHHDLIILLYEFRLLGILLRCAILKYALLWLRIDRVFNFHLLYQRGQTMPRLVEHTVTSKSHLCFFRVDFFKSIALYNSIQQNSKSFFLLVLNGIVYWSTAFKISHKL